MQSQQFSPLPPFSSSHLKAIFPFNEEKKNRDSNDDERSFYRGRSVSSEQENSESEHSEKSPLVSTRSLAKLLFHRSLSTQDNGPNSSRDSESPTRLMNFSLLALIKLINFSLIVAFECWPETEHKKISRILMQTIVVASLALSLSLSHFHFLILYFLFAVSKSVIIILI